jgi:methylmalonyl-CoA/ethylmalonyl-CoA epimerase
MANNWELDHVAVVVRDMEQAIKHYRQVGLEVVIPPEIKTYEGNIISQFKVCFMQNPAIRLEINQPMEGQTLFSEFLDAHGEGVNHIQFRVDDLHKEKAKLVNLGIPVIANFKRPDGREAEIFFETRQFGYVSIALGDASIPFPDEKPAENGWKFHHLGLIVKNVDKAVEFYQSMGFEPLAPIKEPVFAEKAQLWEMYGKPPANPYKIRWCQLQNKQGSFIMEVTQPVEGESLMMDFARQHGEGVNHLHIKVDDLEKEKTNMEKNGFPTIMEVKSLSGKPFETFYDTSKIGNLYFALWSGPGPFNAKPG